MCTLFKAQSSSTFHSKICLQWRGMQTPTGRLRRGFYVLRWTAKFFLSASCIASMTYLATWWEVRWWVLLTWWEVLLGVLVTYLRLKGHLRALPTEIISPAKWRSNRKWRPTNGPADRLATKFPKISSFWWVLQWAAATTRPGSMSLRASAPSTANTVRFRFFVFSEVDGWLAAKVDQ